MTFSVSAAKTLRCSASLVNSFALLVSVAKSRIIAFGDLHPKVVQESLHVFHLGDCRPGELIQLSRCRAVSACRARLSRSSCSGPGAALAAFSRMSLANA